MGNSLGRKTDKQKITPRDRAILDLKVQRDRLKQYQKKIALVITRETDIAKAHLAADNKPLALLALKKKKYQEGLLESTSAQLLNLEQLTGSIEFAQVEQQVFQGLRKGNEVLAELQREVSLEEVEKLMADTAEAIAYQNEISEALAGKLTEADEEDLEAELAALQEELAPSEVEMPQVPVGEPIATVGHGQSESEQEQDQDQEQDHDHDQDRGERMLAE